MFLVVQVMAIVPIDAARLYSPNEALDRIRISFLAWINNLKKKDDDGVESWMDRAQYRRSNYSWSRNKNTGKYCYFIATPTVKRPDMRGTLGSRFMTEWLKEMSALRREYIQWRSQLESVREVSRVAMSKQRKTNPRHATSYLLEIRELDPGIIRSYVSGTLSWEEITRYPAIKIWRYPGVTESINAQLSARGHHFVADPTIAKSLVHDKMREIGTDNCICIEVYAHLCDSMYTAQLGESYTMVRIFTVYLLCNTFNTIVSC